MQHLISAQRDYLELVVEQQGGGTALYLHWLLDRAGWGEVVAETRLHWENRAAGDGLAPVLLAALAPFADWPTPDLDAGPATSLAVLCADEHLEIVAGSSDRYALVIIPWATWALVVEGVRAEWANPGKPLL